ncbi:MAG: hypothetical protein JXN63_00280 [Candidatus Delongbacteria bacterium]|nr:hypothetical protein [Candidatus Delongbacteria bacterium]
MLFSKKDKFESKGFKYLEKKAEAKEIADPLAVILDFLKKKTFLTEFQDYDDPLKVTWKYGQLGEKMKEDLLKSWENSTSKKLSNIRHIAQITPRLGTEYLIEIFAEDNIQAPFGISRVIETPVEKFKNNKFVFHNHKGKKLFLQYATIPSTSKDMLSSWLEFTMEYIYKIGLKDEELEVEYEKLEDITDTEHYFFDRYVIKNIFHFGAEPIAWVSNKIDFEFENYDKKFPDDKKQRCFVHDDLREYDGFPHVIEIQIDVEKLILAALLNNFSQQRVRTSIITTLKLSPQISPVKCVVFPLSVVDQRTRIATERIKNDLNKHFKTLTDDKGTLDMRIEKYNEIGVPFYIEVDPDLVDNNLFTLHDNKFGTKSELDIHDITSYINSKINE